MYHVSFPYVNIHLTLNPIALEIFGIKVHWYGIILAIGFLAGYLYALKYSQKFGIKKDDLSNTVILSTVFAIMCARLYYVIFYPGDFYLKNPLKIFMISEGGIAIYGAVIGGILAILIFSKIKKISALSLLDVMSMGTLIGQCIGRWGNFVNQEAFGTITDLPWAMMSENTYFETVHPCFLYESFGCLIIFLFLHALIFNFKKLKSGDVFLLYMLFYGIIRAFIESFRTDSLIIPHTYLRVSQILAILISLISVATIFIKHCKKCDYT